MRDGCYAKLYYEVLAGFEMRRKRPLFEKSGAKTSLNLGPWRYDATAPV
jgi:hypothetical protein